MVQLNFMDFNLVEGELEKERGMRISAARRQGLLRLAREIAKMLARRNPQRLTDADQVQREMPIWFPDFEPQQLGNAAGSIFRGTEWRWVGWKKSERVSNHARMIRIWKLIDEK